jgi:hypothetical protein
MRFFQIADVVTLKRQVTKREFLHLTSDILIGNGHGLEQTLNVNESKVDT